MPSPSTPYRNPQTLPATLGAYMRYFLPHFLVGSVMLAAFQVAMNRIDWLSKQAIDALFQPGQSPSAAARPALYIFCVAIGAFVARVASRFYCFNAGRDIEFLLRQRLLDCLHRLGSAFYRTMPAGEIMSRATSDLTQVRLLCGFGVMNLVNVLFAVASSLHVMIGISPRLSLATMVIFPLVMLATRLFSSAVFRRTRANQESLGRLTDLVQGNLAGVRVVKSFGLAAHEELRFSSANQEYLGASLALARLRGMMIPIVGATGAIGILVFFGYGSALLLRGPAAGGLSEGGFFAFSLALNRMMWPMIAMGFMLSILQRGRVSFARLKQVYDAQPEIHDEENAEPATLSQTLRVTDLSFSYGDRRVLDGVSFELTAGQSLAVLGKTGSGKSTLAILLSRLLPTPKNSVFLDGKDICGLSLASLRGVVGYAQQDAFLFSTTVARNIGFSLAVPDSAEAVAQIEQAARAAQIYDELQDLPDKLDTIVGERGVQLSGGQKQRVALARALLWQPKLLILDDPLSAVDARTEAAILSALEKKAAQRSLLLVTNRVAAAARCDQIVVLDAGKIVERGTHESLVAQGGLYASFAREQQRESELEMLGNTDFPERQTGDSLPPVSGGQS